MAETNLRQAEARAKAVGIVSEKKLEVVTEDKKTSIKGSLTVKTSDTNFIRYNVNVAELKKDGTPNSVYAGIQTVMNEYKSIAEVGEELADKVSVTGDLNLYHSVKSNQDIVSYKANFFNRIPQFGEEGMSASFIVEMFISTMIPECDKEGSETGRLLVKGWVPTYNGIEPLTLVAPEDIADAVNSTFEPGMTVNFSGSIINNRIEIVKEIPVAIGKPRRDVKYDYVNELVIESASEPYEEGVTPDKPYNEETIKAAIQERTNKIEAAKAQGNAPATKKSAPSAAKTGRTMGF